MDAERFVGFRLFILEWRRPQDDLISVFKYLRRLLTVPSLQWAEKRANGFTFQQERMMQEEYFESIMIKN